MAAARRVFDFTFDTAPVVQDIADDGRSDWFLYSWKVDSIISYVDASEIVLQRVCERAAHIRQWFVGVKWLVSLPD